MPSWALDMTGVFLGAMLGALFGYATSEWQSRQETRSRRDALFRILSEQLHMIPLGSPPHDPSVIVTRGTIHVSAAEELLSGHVLDARNDSRLIRRLVIWRGLEASYNESVRIFNQSVAAGAIPQSHGAAWHANLEVSLTMLREWRPTVLSALPVEYRSAEWKKNSGVPDEGILIQHDVDDSSPSSEE